MMNLDQMATPRIVPTLDPAFRPAVLWNRAFLRAVEESGQAVPIAIAVERDQGQVAVHETKLFPSGVTTSWDEANYFYVERLVKCLLWVKGGWKVTIAGSTIVGERLKEDYAKGGLREFDAGFMGRVYEK